MILPILSHPNPILDSYSVYVPKNEPVGELIDNMFETMYAANGIGLAAVQVGVRWRIIVIDLQDGSDPLHLINPEFDKISGILSEGIVEGCLSVPDELLQVPRFTWSEIKYFDRYWKPRTLRAEGILQICLSHEIDHLNGKTLASRKTWYEREASRRWEETQETYPYQSYVDLMKSSIPHD
jgi:peptide deformylase